MISTNFRCKFFDTPVKIERQIETDSLLNIAIGACTDCEQQFGLFRPCSDKRLFGNDP